MTDKRRYYEAVISQASCSLEKAPVEGRLRVMKNGNRIQYFKCMESGDTKGEYIPKKNIEIAKKLAQRDYDAKIIKCAKEWISWIDKVLKTRPKENLSDLYRQSKKRLELLLPYELSIEEYVKRWESEEYIPNPYPFPDMDLYTDKGERVRSKSELIIANTLKVMDIPYKYEKPLKLGGKNIIYPDFTLLNRSDRQEKFLEHFGLMDDMDYVASTFRKIMEYEKNGYWPGKNLLFTMETSKSPLDTRVLKAMIKESIL